MMSLTEYKAEFKSREGIHFNNAGLTPLPIRVAARAAQVIADLNRYGSFMDRRYLSQLKTGRDRLADYLGAETSEISYFQNCASGLSQVALSMPLSPGDSVLTIDQEYASNYYPWKVACERAGAKFIVFKSETDYAITLEKLLAAIVPGVKCVAVSWVQFQTGTILDLKKLGEHCHSIGAKLVVDGIQGIGQIPISFRDLPVDALAGGSHKWVCGLNGQGYLAVKRAWLDELDPVMVGSGTFNRFGTFADPDAKMETTARKFEAGGVSYVSLLALDEAIALQLDVGRETIRDEISRLSSIFRKELIAHEKSGLKLATPITQIGGITSFALPAEAEAKFISHAQEQQIAVMKRGPFMRASLHAFNNESEIEKVLALIESVLK